MSQRLLRTFLKSWQANCWSSVLNWFTDVWKSWLIEMNQTIWHLNKKYYKLSVITQKCTSVSSWWFVLQVSLYPSVLRSRSRSGERYRWGSASYGITSVYVIQGCNVIKWYLSLCFSGKEEARPPIALAGTVRMERGNETGRGNTDTRIAIALTLTHTGAKERGTTTTPAWLDLSDVCCGGTITFEQ